MKENENNQQITMDSKEFVELFKELKKGNKADASENNDDKRKQSESQLDFIEMAKVLLKKWWLIAVITIVVGVLVFAFFYSRITVTYYATAKMFVNNNNISIGQTSLGGISFNQIGVASNLIETYVEILKTRMTLNVVKARLYEDYGYEFTYYDLYGMISAGSVDGTVIFFIQVRNPDPKVAVRVANTIADVLPDQIENIVEGASARVVDYAVDAVGYSSDVSNKTMVAVAGTFAVVCLVIVLRDYIFNDTISSSEWVTGAFGNIPILAEIPDVGVNVKDEKYYRYYYYRSEDGNKKK